MSLQNIATHLAQHGRGNDTVLVHMTPKEVGGLQHLAQQNGGSLTINPHTGLPEAGFLDKLLPTIIGAGLTYFTGMDPMTAAALVGGTQAARTGNLGEGIAAGFGAYAGGAGLNALSGAGAGTLATEAGVKAGELALQSGGTEAAKMAAIDQAAELSNPSNFAKLSAGVQGLGTEAGRASVLSGLGGGMGAAKTGLMALAPMMTASQPTTSMPTTQGNPNQRILTGIVNPYTHKVMDVSNVAASDWGTRTRQGEINAADLSRYAADGGLMTSNQNQNNAPGMFNYAQMQPSVDLNPNSGVTPKNMAEGGVAHFADGGFSNQQISDYVSNIQAQGGGDKEIAAAMDQFHVGTGQLAGALGMNVGDVQSRYNTAAPTGGYATTASQVLNPFTSYTPQQMGDYIQQTGLNLSDPTAVAAAIKSQHADPAAVNSYLASLANPYSATSLANPTATSVSNFDALLGRPSADTEIKNAVYTAQLQNNKDFTTANIPANTQLAKEMDTWQVNPAAMAKAVGKSEVEIQQLYNAVNPNGKYSTVPKIVDSIVVPPTKVVAGATSTGTTPTGANLNTITLPSGKTVTLNPTNLTTANVLAPTNLNTAPANTLASGVSGTTGPSQIGGGATINPNGTITESARLPDIPIGGFDSIQQLMDATTRRGDSLGFVPKAPSTIDEFNSKFNKLSGQSKASFSHLMGGADTPVPVTSDGQIMKPYWDQMAGTSSSTVPPANTRWYFDPKTHKVVENTTTYKAPDLTSSGTTGMVGSTITIPDVGKAMFDANSGYYYINGKYYDKNGKLVDYTAPSDNGGGGGDANGGLMRMARGGMADGDLGGYSDGGRLLRGPGDGVSDSIPATIANKRPARLADGEFVVPARIVSELGNGSTEAGAKQLYAMMDRIQQARSKTVGKGRVATNSRSAKYLPA